MEMWLSMWVPPEQRITGDFGGGGRNTRQTHIPGIPMMRVLTIGISPETSEKEVASRC